MAKKVQRKPNLPQETLARARRELYGETVDPGTNATPQVSAAAPVAQVIVHRSAAPVASEANLVRDYAYVIKDLRNMATLAAMLMIVLVVMSFFI